MGGCEVRTSKKKNPHAIRPTAPVKRGRKKLRPFAHTAVYLASALSALVTVAIPIIFLTGSFNLVDREEANMIGVITAICAGMFWVMTGHVRDFVRLPGKDASEEEIAEMHLKTKRGILVRMFATLMVFACPILFVVNAFEGDEPEMRFAAIVSAILGVGMFALAGHIDEVLRVQETT